MSESQADLQCAEHMALLGVRKQDEMNGCEGQPF